MAVVNRGRKLFIARFRIVGDRKTYTWVQWHHDGQSARAAFKKALEREFPRGFVLLSAKTAKPAEEKKILAGHSIGNPAELLSAVLAGAAAGTAVAVTGHHLKKRLARNPWVVIRDFGFGQQKEYGPVEPTKAAAQDRLRRYRHAWPGSTFKVVPKMKGRRSNSPTGFSIAMVPRKGPRLVLPRVFASKGEAQQRARKIRRPFGTRTVIVPAARNPYDAAAAASEGFHGRPVEETIEIVTSEHHHEYLAALGELISLEVLAPDSEQEVIPLNGFKGAWLAENEQRNQLFVRGGNQSLGDAQLRRFDIDVETLHETEVLGPLAAITYHTIKYHLGDQGGNAKYRHVFAEDGGKLPVLIYQVRDGLVKIAGGSYTIPEEGITN